MCVCAARDCAEAAVSRAACTVQDTGGARRSLPAETAATQGRAEGAADSGGPRRARGRAVGRSSALPGSELASGTSPSGSLPATRTRTRTGAATRTRPLPATERTHLARETPASAVLSRREKAGSWPPGFRLAWSRRCPEPFFCVASVPHLYLGGVEGSGQPHQLAACRAGNGGQVRTSAPSPRSPNNFFSS